MAKAPPWVPPPDPDFQQLAYDGFRMWQADRPTHVSFDCETTGLAYFDTAFCVTAAWNRPDGSVVGHYFELEKFDSSKGVVQMLDGSNTLIGHNIKFDIQKTALAGILNKSRLTPENIEDTQLMAHLLDEYRSKKLKDLMVSVLKWDNTVQVPYKSGPKMKSGEMRTVVQEDYVMQEARTKLKLKKSDGYDKLPRGIVMPYAVADAVGTHRLFRDLETQIKVFPDMYALYRQETELTLVLLEMEDAGLRVDMDYTRKQIKEYTKRVLVIDNRIAEIVGKPVVESGDDDETKKDGFNPNSNPQIKEIFVGLGFDLPSYNAEALGKIRHPLAAALVERRKDSKLLSTYFMAIKNEQRDNILHPSFRQNVSTGRMASGGAEAD